jgi:rubrerythrin
MKSKVISKQLLAAQRNEISEYHVYEWLARRTKDQSNREIIEHIAREELEH